MIIFLDEVGCASIASSVLVCGLALPTETSRLDIKGIKDSKKLSRKQRDELFPQILSQVHYAFGSASPKKIAEKNLHYAKYEAMKIAVLKLARQGIKIEKIIVDGKFTIPNLEYNQEAIVKADSLVWGVAAASILAKVKRDNMMTQLSQIEKYSHYGWETNAGYFTFPEHRNGIAKFGPTDLHRKGFEYFKYCLFCRKKCLELGSFEDFLEFEKKEIIKHGTSLFTLWKKGDYQEWKEIKFGE